MTEYDYHVQWQPAGTEVTPSPQLAIPAIPAVSFLASPLQSFQWYLQSKVCYGDFNHFVNKPTVTRKILKSWTKLIIHLYLSFHWPCLERRLGPLSSLEGSPCRREGKPCSAVVHSGWKEKALLSLWSAVRRLGREAVIRKFRGAVVIVSLYGGPVWCVVCRL